MIDSFDAVVTVVDQPNKNGHVYTTETMKRAISDTGGVVFGQLGMIERDTIDLHNASHKVTNLGFHERDGVTYCIGTVTILSTLSGSLLRDISKTLSDTNQPPFDFRMAGTGKVDENGIVSDYRLISINAVQDGA